MTESPPSEMNPDGGEVRENRNAPVQEPDTDLIAAIEEETHSFVIRLWSEPRAEVRSNAEWRGWVQHVQNGERRYFRDLAEIGHIVASHLGGTPLA